MSYGQYGTHLEDVHRVSCCPCKCNEGGDEKTCPVLNKTMKSEYTHDCCINKELERERLEGVHASHCCRKHGCKYGDDIYGDGCPVVDKKVEQMFPCEMCYVDFADNNSRWNLCSEVTPENNREVLVTIVYPGTSKEHVKIGKFQHGVWYVDGHEYQDAIKAWTDKLEPYRREMIWK